MRAGTLKTGVLEVGKFSRELRQDIQTPYDIELHDYELFCKRVCSGIILY
jgi:hypothetical protein